MAVELGAAVAVVTAALIYAEIDGISLSEPRLGLAGVATGAVGRNDPCLCGSGRKFKKCCADRADRPPTLDVGRPETAKAARATDALHRKVGFTAELPQVWVLGEVEAEGPGFVEGVVAGQVGLHKIVDPDAVELVSGEVRTLAPAVRPLVDGLLEREGVGALGMGSNRLVVPFGADGWAAKVSWTAVGFAANLHEASAWLALEDTKVRHLAPVGALTATGALVVRRGDPLIEPLLPENLRERYAQRAAFLRGDESEAGEPVQNQRSSWEPEIHRLRRSIGEAAQHDPRLDNYGIVDGRLVAFEWKVAGLGEILCTVGQWLQRRVAERGLLALDRGVLRPELAEHFAALGLRLPGEPIAVTTSKGFGSTPNGWK